MVELSSDVLGFHFPEVHPKAHCRISFVRTLRIPDDGREYPLPPGFSRFPLYHVEDFGKRLPATWAARGGVFFPMYQAEALWIEFSGDYPMAVRVAAGKINAVSGEPWEDELAPGTKQDYAVIPEQPWLDGFYAGRGRIRQFVAMPLGEGITVEEQITGEAKYGGLQVVVYPMKAKVYRRKFERRRSVLMSPGPMAGPPGVALEMGLAPGGRMRQEIFDDLHGIESWEPKGARCFVHILNSLQFLAATGEKPPGRPPGVGDYIRAGLPWFDYYDAEQSALERNSKLMELKSVGEAPEATDPTDHDDEVPRALALKRRLAESRRRREVREVRGPIDPAPIDPSVIKLITP